MKITKDSIFNPMCRCGHKMADHQRTLECLHLEEGIPAGKIAMYDCNCEEFKTAKRLTRKAFTIAGDGRAGNDGWGAIGCRGLLPGIVNPSWCTECDTRVSAHFAPCTCGHTYAQHANSDVTLRQRVARAGRGIIPAACCAAVGRLFTCGCKSYDPSQVISAESICECGHREWKHLSDGCHHDGPGSLLHGKPMACICRDFRNSGRYV